MGSEEQEKFLKKFLPIFLQKKRPEEIITYITTETEYIREMPVFRTMPAEEAKAITDHLLTLQKTYDKTGPQIKQLLIEP